MHLQFHNNSCPLLQSVRLHNSAAVTTWNADVPNKSKQKLVRDSGFPCQQNYSWVTTDGFIHNVSALFLRFFSWFASGTA